MWYHASLDLGQTHPGPRGDGRLRAGHLRGACPGGIEELQLGQQVVLIALEELFGAEVDITVPFLLLDAEDDIALDTEDNNAFDAEDDRTVAVPVLLQPRAARPLVGLQEL
jgi:hypothetical protein